MHTHWLAVRVCYIVFLALGWTVIVVFLVISMIYKNIIPVNELGYLFWYFSGCIFAESHRNRGRVFQKSYRVNNAI